MKPFTMKMACIYLILSYLPLFAVAQSNETTADIIDTIDDANVPIAMITIGVLAVFILLGFGIAKGVDKCHDRRAIRDDASDISDFTKDLLKAQFLYAFNRKLIGKVKAKETVKQRARRMGRIWASNARRNLATRKIKHQEEEPDSKVETAETDVPTKDSQNEEVKPKQHPEDKGKEYVVLDIETPKATIRPNVEAQDKVKKEKTKKPNKPGSAKNKREVTIIKVASKTPEPEEDNKKPKKGFFQFRKKSAKATQDDTSKDEPRPVSAKRPETPKHIDASPMKNDPDKPETSRKQSIPVAVNVSRTDLHRPGTATRPGTAARPGTARQPLIQSRPGTAKRPETPKQPETPKRSDTPKSQESAKRPETPKATEMPKQAKGPEVVLAPKLLLNKQNSKVADAPKDSNIGDSSKRPDTAKSRKSVVSFAVTPPKEPAAASPKKTPAPKENPVRHYMLPKKNPPPKKDNDPKQNATTNNTKPKATAKANAKQPEAPKRGPAPKAAIISPRKKTTPAKKTGKSTNGKPNSKKTSTVLNDSFYSDNWESDKSDHEEDDIPNDDGDDDDGFSVSPADETKDESGIVPSLLDEPHPDLDLSFSKSNTNNNHYKNTPEPTERSEAMPSPLPIGGDSALSTIAGPREATSIDNKNPDPELGENEHRHFVRFRGDSEDLLIPVTQVGDPRPLAIVRTEKESSSECSSREEYDFLASENVTNQKEEANPDRRSRSPVRNLSFQMGSGELSRPNTSRPARSSSSSPATPTFVRTSRF